MRIANGKLYLAENGSGIVSALTISGVRAHVTVLKDGLKTLRAWNRRRHALVHPRPQTVYFPTSA